MSVRVDLGIKWDFGLQKKYFLIFIQHLEVFVFSRNLPACKMPRAAKQVDKEDPEYLEKRAKNNEAIKKSREKARTKARIILNILARFFEND